VSQAVDLDSRQAMRSRIQDLVERLASHVMSVSPGFMWRAPTVPFSEDVVADGS
jgi:hypothetical protein